VQSPQMLMILIVFVAVSLFALVYLLCNLLIKPELINSRVSRQILYIRFCILTFMVLSLTGTNFRDNWSMLGFSIFLNLAGYFSLSVIRLITKPLATIKKIVRPLAALLMVIVTLLQIGSNILAGPAFEIIAAGIPSELITNFWMWLGSLFCLLYISGCLLLVFKETWQAEQKMSDTLSYSSLYLKFSYLKYKILSGLGFAFFALLFVGILGYGLSHWGAFYDISMRIRDLVFIVFTIVTLLEFFKGKSLYQFYQRFHQKQLMRYLTQIEPFYQNILELFPSPYLSNAYYFIEFNSRAWLLSSVVKTICDVRMRLWKVEALEQAQATGIALDSIRLPRVVSYKSELKLWLKYSGDPETAQKVNYRLKDLGNLVIPVPDIKVANNNCVEQLARYFSKLAVDSEKSLLATKKREVYQP